MRQVNLCRPSGVTIQESLGSNAKFRYEQSSNGLHTLSERLLPHLNSKRLVHHHAGRTLALTYIASGVQLIQLPRSHVVIEP